MTEPTVGTDPATPVPPDTSRRRAVLAAAVVVALIVGVVAERALFFEPSPSNTSADAGFARDMQEHHAQAVRMSMIVRDRTDDPDVRLLAYDIATSQQHQIGQMYGWLTMWGLSQTAPGPPMAWVGGTGHDGMGMGQQTGAEVQMPGMATAEDLAKLESLSGVDAEIFFLQLMIAHHQGGVVMAEAALEQARTPEVKRLAQAIITAQKNEITAMQDMLAARGEQP